MKDSNIIALLRDNFKVVRVTFALLGAQQGTTIYSYKAPLGVALERNDAVIVPNALDKDNTKPYAVAYVYDVLDASDLDLSADFDYKWMVSKVDTTEFAAIAAEEAELRGIIVKARKEQYRRSLKAELLTENPELAKLIEVK